VTLLERIAIEIAGGIAALAAVLIWWHVHNANEQKLGARECIQTTTIDKTQAKAEVASDQAAQAAFLPKVVQGYETKVASLQSANDDLAGRLSALGAIRPSGMPNSRSAACPGAADRGLSQSESAAQERLGRIRADLKLVLDACDANQVKTESLAEIYGGVRDRALAAEKKGATSAP
jgi:hypothetical protein